MPDDRHGDSDQTLLTLVPCALVAGVSTGKVEERDRRVGLTGTGRTGSIYPRD